jgi:hypothetical protein
MYNSAMTQDFSIAEALRFGWHKTRAHSAVLFQSVLALFAVQIATSVVEKVLGGSIEGFLALVALGVASVIVSTGFTSIALKLAKGEHASLGDLLPASRMVWTFFLASVVTGLIVVGGIILLIVPGLYFLARFSMARFAVLDGATVRESLAQSSALTDGKKLHILGFILTLIGLNLLGALFFFVGLLVTVPVSAVAFAHVYLKLKKHP